MIRSVMSSVAYCIIFILVTFPIVYQISKLSVPVIVKSVAKNNQHKSDTFSRKKGNKLISLGKTLNTTLSLTEYAKTPTNSALQEKYIKRLGRIFQLESTSNPPQIKSVKKLELLHNLHRTQPRISHATLSKEITQRAEPIIANEKSEILLTKNAELIEIPQTTSTNSDLITTNPSYTKIEQLSSPVFPNRPMSYNLVATIGTTKSSDSKKNLISSETSTQHMSWNEEPCWDPSLANCISSESLKITELSLPYEPDNPAGSCPRWYGHFPLDYTECSKYIRCEFGRPTIMHCPAGLVFNAKLEACDWPVNVPSCNPEVFHGFKCPVSELYGTPDDIINFRYGQSCKKYIACQEGRPRLLNCDLGLSFSHETRSCIRSDFVLECKT